MKIEVITINLEDVGTVYKLTENIWRKNFPTFISTEQTEYMLQKFKSIDKIKEKLTSNDINNFFILHTKKIVGYFSYGFDADNNFMRFYEMYILPDFQHQGIGTTVFNYVKSELRSNGHKYLNSFVNINNLPSINACKKAGFKIVKSVKIDIGNGYFMNDHLFKLEI